MKRVLSALFISCGVLRLVVYSKILRNIDKFTWEPQFVRMEVV